MNEKNEQTPPDDDQVLVSRRVLTDALAAVESIPARVKAHDEETIRFVEKSFRTLSEMSIDAMNAIVAAIPAALRRHAPNLTSAEVSAIAAEISDHATARIQTLVSAKALLVRPDGDSSQG